MEKAEEDKARGEKQFSRKNFLAAAKQRSSVENSFEAAGIVAVENLKPKSIIFSNESLHNLYIHL